MPLVERYHISLGNKRTLEIIPKEKGVNVREELLKFHDTWYSSNIMALAVLGKGKLLPFINCAECILVVFFVNREFG